MVDFSDFQGLVALTLTLDLVILHTVMRHSSTPTYIPNFIDIEETFCGRTDGRTFETHFIRSTRTQWRCRPSPPMHSSQVVQMAGSIATSEVGVVHPIFSAT